MNLEKGIEETDVSARDLQFLNLQKRSQHVHGKDGSKVDQNSPGDNHSSFLKQY